MFGIYHRFSSEKMRLREILEKNLSTFEYNFYVVTIVKGSDVNDVIKKIIYINKNNDTKLNQIKVFLTQTVEHDGISILNDLISLYSNIKNFIDSMLFYPKTIFIEKISNLLLDLDNSHLSIKLCDEFDKPLWYIIHKNINEFGEEIIMNIPTKDEEYIIQFIKLKPYRESKSRYEYYLKTGKDNYGYIWSFVSGNEI